MNLAFQLRDLSVYQDIFTNQELVVGSKNNADRRLKSVIGQILLSEVQVNYKQ